MSVCTVKCVHMTFVSLFSVEVLSEDVQKAIDGLKKGKAAGMDGISSEHFIYASDKASTYLCMLFNCMLDHGYCANVIG